MRRIPLLHVLMEQFGIDTRRVRLEWVSAAEGPKFAKVVTEFTETIRRLGPIDGPAEEPLSAEVAYG
jgi:F420-non-reducing hydrogenase iron-sulfur subunit